MISSTCFFLPPLHTSIDGFYHERQKCQESDKTPPLEEDRWVLSQQEIETKFDLGRQSGTAVSLPLECSNFFIYVQIDPKIWVTTGPSQMSDNNLIKVAHNNGIRRRRKVVPVDWMTNPRRSVGKNQFRVSCYLLWDGYRKFKKRSRNVTCIIPQRTLFFRGNVDLKTCPERFRNLTLFSEI